jgi:hypothetical protein
MTFIDIAKDEPQRHRDTERAQSRVSSQPRRHEDTKESQSSLDYRRGPGRRAAVDRWERMQPRTQASGAAPTPSGPRSRRARASPLTLIKVPRSSRYECGGTDAPCASAGGKSDRDGCLHPERSSFPPGAGDHRIAGVAAAPLRATSPTEVSPLCDSFVFFVSSWLRRCSPLRPLCLCGSSGAMLESTSNATTAGRSGAIPPFSPR